MNKTKIIVTVVGLLVLIGGIAAGTFLVQNRQNLTNKAVGTTTASINPSPQNVAAGQTFSLTVNLNTGGNQVMGVDLFITFDPNLIQIDSRTKGSAISGWGNETSSRNTLDNSTGNLEYFNFTTDTAAAANGSSAEVLTISGTVKSGATGTALINFGSNTSVTASGESQTVLTGSSGASIVISGGPTATPTLTPTPTPTTPGGPTATPTATPTDDPDATDTPTATPTSAPGATLTPTPTATSSNQSSSNTSATPTPAPPTLPESGNSLPTIFAGVLGVIVIIASIVIAL